MAKNSQTDGKKGAKNSIPPGPAPLSSDKKNAGPASQKSDNNSK